MEVEYVPNEGMQDYSPGPREAGVKVFVSDPEEVWAPAEVTAINDDGTCEVLTDSGKKMIVPTNHLPSREEILDIEGGLENMSHLTYLHDASLLQNLSVRFQQDLLYTFTGCMLIAMNPFKWLNIYGPDYIEQYREKDLEDCRPHVFAVAEKAYRLMRKENKDQSILVSGESGAGKTETVKIVMNYLAAVSGSMDNSGDQSVSDKVLKSNPILEAFGNAKTVRNNNSSRFGKFIDIQFDKAGKVVGANIRTYLLEKSRVVRQAAGERNYHIFYQLCLAFPDALQAYGIRLDAAENYRFLNQGNLIHIPGKDDEEDFLHTMEAMDTVGITHQEKADIFRLLAAILYLGEMDFQAHPTKEDTCQLVKTQAVSNVAALLGCTEEQLEHAFTLRTVTVPGGSVITQNNLVQCNTLRDAMCKETYKRMFDWLVKRVNESIMNKKQTHNFIGVLDIFGFESFKVNSFEQLCINYANEKLQQLFITNVLKNEQIEYDKERIVWQKVDYNDNQECVELLEKKGGVLSLLDEECMFPRGSDETFNQKIKERCGPHKHFRVPKLVGGGGKSRGRGATDGPDPKVAFGINHYAREVMYDATGFLEKNKDQFSIDATTLLNKCSFSWLSSMFPPPADGGKRAGALQSSTVGTQFKDQLLDLMSKLGPTTLHYVSCIKPNSILQPNVIERPLVVGQLRCAGVLEAIQVARKMYPFRMKHDEFFTRFKCMLPPFDCGDYASGAGTILERLLPEETGKMSYQIGKTKIFIMQKEIDVLEGLRLEWLNHNATVIQAAAKRRFALDWRYLAISKLLVIQAAVRMKLATNLMEHLRMEKMRVAVLAIPVDVPLPPEVEQEPPTPEPETPMAKNKNHHAKDKGEGGFFDTPVHKPVEKKAPKAPSVVTKPKRPRENARTMPVAVDKIDDAKLFEYHCNDLHTLLTHDFDNKTRLHGFQSFYSVYLRRAPQLVTTAKFEDTELIDLLIKALRRGSGDPFSAGEWSAALLALLAMFAMSEANALMLYENRLIQTALLEMDRFKLDHPLQQHACTLLLNCGSHQSIRKQVEIAGGVPHIMRFVLNAVHTHPAQMRLLRVGLRAMETWMPSCAMKEAKRYMLTIVTTIHNHPKDAIIQIAGSTAIYKFLNMPAGMFGKSTRQICLEAGVIPAVLGGIQANLRNSQVLASSVQVLIHMSSKKKAAAEIKEHLGDKILNEARPAVPSGIHIAFEGMLKTISSAGAA